jgi:hypothetical protein
MHIRQSNLGAFPCNGSTTFVMAVNNTIASPCTSVFLGKFQGLQRSINDFIDTFSQRVEDVPAKVRVDGDIGPLVTAAARQVWEIGDVASGISNWPSAPPSSAKDLAENVDIYSAAFAAAAGGPVDRTADPASQKPPAADTSDFKPPPGPAKAGIGGAIFLAGLAGVVAYKVFGKKKR